MSRFIHALEPRRLLSASPDQFTADLVLTADLQQTVSDGNSILGDVFTCRMQIIGDGKATNAALRALPHTGANRKLLSASRATQNQWLTTFMRDYRAVIGAGLTEGRRAVKDGTTLSDDPSDTAAASRLLSELKTLQQRTAAPLAKFLADMPKATAALGAQLAAIAASNPADASLQSHVTTETMDANACLTTLQGDAKTARADVAMLIADLASP